MKYLGIVEDNQGVSIRFPKFAYFTTSPVGDYNEAMVLAITGLQEIISHCDEIPESDSLELYNKSPYIIMANIPKENK